MKKDSKNKSKGQDFVDTIRNNADIHSCVTTIIIDWCKREIAEYQKLIEILEKK